MTNILKLETTTPNKTITQQELIRKAEKWIDESTKKPTMTYDKFEGRGTTEIERDHARVVIQDFMLNVLFLDN